MRACLPAPSVPIHLGNSPHFQTYTALADYCHRLDISDNLPSSSLLLTKKKWVSIQRLPPYPIDPPETKTPSHRNSPSPAVPAIAHSGNKETASPTPPGPAKLSHWPSPYGSPPEPPPAPPVSLFRPRPRLHVQKGLDLYPLLVGQRDNVVVEQVEAGSGGCSMWRQHPCTVEVKRHGEHTNTTPLLWVLLLQRGPHPRRVVAPQGALQREHAAPEGFGVGGLGIAGAGAGGGGVLVRGGGGRGRGRGQGHGASPGRGALFAMVVVRVRGSPLGLSLGLGGFGVEEGVGMAVRGAGGDGVEVEVGGGGSA